MKTNIVLNGSVALSVAIAENISSYVFKLLVIKNLRRRHLKVDSASLYLSQNNRTIEIDDRPLVPYLQAGESLSVTYTLQQQLPRDEFCGFIIY